MEFKRASRLGWAAWGLLQDVLGVRDWRAVLAMLGGLITGVWAVLTLTVEFWVNQGTELKVVSLLGFGFLGFAAAAKVIGVFRDRLSNELALNVRYSVMYFYEHEAEFDFYGVVAPIRRVLIEKFSVVNREPHDVTLYFTLHLPLDLRNMRGLTYNSIDISLSLNDEVPRVSDALTEPQVIRKERPSKTGCLDFVIDPVKWLRSFNGEAIEWKKAELHIKDEYSDKTLTVGVGDKYFPFSEEPANPPTEPNPQSSKDAS